MADSHEATLLEVLDKSQRPYRIRLVNELLNQDDECPIYNIRVAKKNAKEVVRTNLKCQTKPLPEEKLVLNGPEFHHRKTYSMDSDFLMDLYNNAEQHTTIDVLLEV